MLAAFEVAVAVGVGALVQPKHLAFYWGFGVGVAAAMVMTLADSPPHHCVPPVRARADLVPCERSDGTSDHLLVFAISPSDGVVHANTKDEVYLRVGDETRRLTFAQRQELVFDRGHESYEARPIQGSSLDDVDAELLSEYVHLVGGSDPGRVMQARGLLVDGHLSVAGCLLFARHPQTWLPEAFVRVLRYQGRERGSGARQRLVADDRFDGPLPTVIAGARERVTELQSGVHADRRQRAAPSVGRADRPRARRPAHARCTGDLGCAPRRRATQHRRDRRDPRSLAAVRDPSPEDI